MMHKVWSRIEEVPYCFFRSSIKCLGHTGWKIDDLDQIWARLLGWSQLSNPSNLPYFYRISHSQRNTVPFNTLRLKQNGRHFTDDIFKCILLNENVLISMKISLKFVPQGPINNTPALILIMAWRRTDDKPLSEPMMAYVANAYMRHSASVS